MSKEIILNYCSELKTNDIDYLQNALENKSLIEHKEFHLLNGCPSNYGLDDHVGLCEIEDVGNEFKKQEAQCLSCWKQALGVTE